MRFYVQSGDHRGKPPPYGHHTAKAMSHIGLGSGANERANNSAAHRVTHATSHRVIRRMFIPLVGHFTAFPVKSESAPADLSAPLFRGAAAARSHLPPTSGSGRFNLIFGGAAHARRALADAEG